MVGRPTPHLNTAGRSRLPAWMGEAEDTRMARACLLTSSSEWEGNGVSHDARKDVRLMQTRERTFLFTDMAGIRR